MSNRQRRFQERLTDLEQQWVSGPLYDRLRIERAMLRIIAMEEVILQAQERMEKAEQRLAHAEEILKRLEQED